MRSYLLQQDIYHFQMCIRDRWIGVGGHFEADESPEECLMREVKEETGYTLTSYRYRGIVTFVSGDGVTEYMSLFTADGFEGEPIDCDEGEDVYKRQEGRRHWPIWSISRFRKPFRTGMMFLRRREKRQEGRSIGQPKIHWNAGSLCRRF